MAALTEAGALERLRGMVAASSEPTLEDDELVSLLDGARRQDKYSAWPDDDGWQPTYDLNAAAAEGWRRKAGKVVASFDFSADADSFSESQVHAMCLEQARVYAAKVIGSTSLAARADDSYVVVNRSAD